MNEKLTIFKKSVALFFITFIVLSGCISTQTETETPTKSPKGTEDDSTHYEIVDLRVSPENPTVGDTLTILVDVQNREDSAVSCEIVVGIGIKIRNKKVELEAKSYKTVMFEEVLDTAGEMEVSTGHFSKKITVTSSETPVPTTPSPTTTPSPETSFFYTLDGRFVQITDYTYTISLEPGNENNVYVNVPLVPSVSRYHFSQKVLEQTTEYSKDPDSITTRKEDDARYERAEWTDPPSEITVTRQVKCSNTVRYSPFITQSSYPLNTDILQYLNSEPNIQSDDPEIEALAEGLVQGSESAMDATVKILNWVRYHIEYTCSKDLMKCERVLFIDAKRTLTYKKGNCVNFANLSIALLRAVGIPAKMSHGYVADSDYESAAAHAWISVYLPEKGFIEFESSYWMPRSSLVPETVLMPQHIQYPSNIGITNIGSFNEAHNSTREVSSLPEKKTEISESIDKRDIISFFAYVEREDWHGSPEEYCVSLIITAPQGWKVFLSNDEITIDSSNYFSKEILVTVIPPSNAQSGAEAEIVITADDGSEKRELTFVVSIH